VAAELLNFQVNGIARHNNSVVSGLSTDNDVLLDCYYSIAVASIYVIDSSGNPTRLSTTKGGGSTNAHYIRYLIQSSEKTYRHKYQCSDGHNNVQVYLEYGKTFCNLNNTVGVGLVWCLECLQVSNRPGCSPFVNHLLQFFVCHFHPLLLLYRKTRHTQLKLLLPSISHISVHHVLWSLYQFCDYFHYSKVVVLKFPSKLMMKLYPDQIRKAFTTFSAQSKSVTGQPNMGCSCIGNSTYRPLHYGYSLVEQSS